ncbi:MAG: VCBS repeat-containing protein, partial [Oscillospiraceae bacterium]|nr:VCBS repeat-containing protein [Oscillospiraceae bacterium]
MKRAFSLLLCVIIIVAFSGCSSFGIDIETRMRPPLPSGEQEEIQKALTEYLATTKLQQNYILKYPKTGEHRSAFILADIDGDGLLEMVSGSGSLVWYKPDNMTKGVIAANRHFHVGMGSGDIDGDGAVEICVGEADPGPNEKWEIVILKPNGNVNNKWERIVIDPSFEGGPHDILF